MLNFFLDDELYKIIYLPQWFYNNKYLRCLRYCYLFSGTLLVCLLLHSTIRQWKHAISMDFLLAAIFLMVICVEKKIAPAGIWTQDQSQGAVIKASARPGFKSQSGQIFFPTLLYFLVRFRCSITFGRREKHRPTQPIPPRPLLGQPLYKRTREIESHR